MCATGSGCTSPNRCNQCNSASHFSATDENVCECDADWYGESCEFYGGACNDKCINCTGGSAWDCIECSINAHRSKVLYPLFAPDYGFIGNSAEST